MYEFKVIVSLEVEDERIVVVGDCPELGDWDPENGLQLSPLHTQEGLYGSEKEIEKEAVEYRYVILSKNPKLPGLPNPEVKDGERTWRIQQVECHDRPRRRLATSETPVDHFGTIDGLYRTDHGWITKDSVIQLKLFNDAIMIWNESFVGKKGRIRISSFVHKGSMKNASFGPDCLGGYRTGPPLWFSDLNETDVSSFEPQPESGVPLSAGDLCLTFQTALTRGLSKLGFMAEVFFDNMEEVKSEDGSASPDRAFSLLLPSHLSKSCGVLTVPLCTLDHELIGEIRVEHIVITPTMRTSHHFLSRLYSKNWRKTWVGLEIGHRGLGTSFTPNERCRAMIRENTFHSFVEAGKMGADMIELDVHLTADKIPVIYHDFQAPVKLASKKSRMNGDFNGFDELGQSHFMLAIRDRTFNELQDIIINNESDFEKSMRENGRNEDDPLKDPFPSLKSIVEALDPSIGINVEVKYPNHLTAESREFDRPFDMNEYLDVIITTLEESPVERLIVLSCFNPDVCHALKLKQTSFPVLFLTQGVTTKWPPYMDPRTKSTDYAIRFAKATELMGISCHAEEILTDMSLIRRCLAEGLVMFIWGEDTNSVDAFRQFKNLGVHGIIVDRLDAVTEKVEKSSVLKKGSTSL